MKRKLVFPAISIAFILAFTGCSQSVPKGTIDPEDIPGSLGTYDYNDFRNAKWLMSIDEVKATEQSEPKDADEYVLHYDGIKICGLDCTASYFFIDGQLNFGTYSFDAHRKADEGYVEDYKIICDALNEKYGEVIFTDEYDLSKTDHLLPNIESAYKGYVTRWVSGHNTITASLSLRPASDLEIYLYDTEVIGDLFIMYNMFYTTDPYDYSPFVYEEISSADTSGL